MCSWQRGVFIFFLRDLKKSTRIGFFLEVNRFMLPEKSLRGTWSKLLSPPLLSAQSCSDWSANSRLSLITSCVTYNSPEWSLIFFSPLKSTSAWALIKNTIRNSCPYNQFFTCLFLTAYLFIKELPITPRQVYLFSRIMLFMFRWISAFVRQHRSEMNLAAVWCNFFSSVSLAAGTVTAAKKILLG